MYYFLSALWSGSPLCDISVAMHSNSKLCTGKMFYTFWIVLFVLSIRSSMIATESLGFSHFLRKNDFSLSNSILDSIVESFLGQGPVYCIVVIYDDIFIQSKSLSKLKSIFFWFKNSIKVQFGSITRS